MVAADLIAYYSIGYLSHLCNVARSSIGVYLSLEALARQTAKNGAPIPQYIPYEAAMRAHTLILADMCTNIEANRVALLGTKFYERCMSHAAPQTLFYAALRTLEVAKLIPEAIAPKNEAETADDPLMPDTHVVGQIRVACDELDELCMGNQDKGIVGWKGCWAAVQSIN